MKRNMLLLSLGLCLGVVATPTLAERPAVDPTRPPADIHNDDTAGSSSIPKLRLQSIWYKEGFSRAHIDGQAYRVGDSIGQWRVENIRASEVELTQGSEKLVLTVFERTQMTISRGNE